MRRARWPPGCATPRRAAAATCCSWTRTPGEYGCLAEWEDPAAAAAFAERPAVREEIASLGRQVGKAPRVRLYVMEEA